MWRKKKGNRELEKGYVGTWGMKKDLNGIEKEREAGCV